MVKCPQCGADMPTSEKFCMRCGKDLPQQVAAPPTKAVGSQSTKQSPTHPAGAATPAPPQTPTVYRPGQPGTGIKPWVWIVIAVAVVAGILLILYFTGVFGTDDRAVTDDGQTTVSTATVDVTWESETALPTAFYTNSTERLLRVTFESDQPTSVTVSVEIPGITEKETKTIDVTSSPKGYDFKPSFLQEAYGPLKEAQDKDIQLTVVDETGKTVVEESIPIRILSREDMVWVSEDGATNYQYIAKWVTKDSPEVKELVRVAADYNEAICGVPAMVGYLGDETMVACQLASIFAAMQDYYQIKYIASPESYQTSNAQKIRLPEDIILERSGLCIETTVLVAAALENLGMEPVIIIIPGHAWVAVKAYPGAPYYFHLETTMLDADVLDAMAAGEDNWYFDGGSAISVVDIKKARADGIMPFGSTEGEAIDL
ncbi:zinc ribbon domain-containing protein [Patescibacteria group bacterium]